MMVLSLLLATLASAPGAHAEGAAAPQPTSAQALLEQALTLAESVPDAAQRADAVGLVAAELAKTNPKRTVKLVAGQMASHAQSEAMARAAETLAGDNRLLGLATLIRVSDRSAALVAIGRIIAMEALIDLDEAVDLTSKMDSLTVRRQTEREVSRIVWDELPGDKQKALQVAVQWAETILDPLTEGEALAYAAQGAARLQGAEAAAPIISRISSDDARDLAWRLVVQEIAPRDPVGAEALLGRIGAVFQRNLAAVSVVAGMAAGGRPADALRLAREIRSSVEKSLEDPRDQGLILGETAEAIVGVDHSTALSILASVWPPVKQYGLQCQLAPRVAEKDPKAAREMLEDAWLELRRMDSPLLREELASEALTGAMLCAPDLVDAMAKEQPQIVQNALPRAVGILAPKHPELASKLVERIGDPVAAESAKVAVITAIAGTQPSVAQELAEGLVSPGARSNALVALATAMGTAAN